jgi:hypothetical protein
MGQRKFWGVEEVIIEDGSIAQRQTQISFQDNEDGSWHWVCPSDRLSEQQQEEWHRIMDRLKDVDGEDLRHIVCGVGLMDHCFGKEDLVMYEEPEPAITEE